MLGKVRAIVRSLYLKRLVKNGLMVGDCFQMEKGCNIDAVCPWLIKIGDNVTFATNVCVLAHDASTKKLTGYTRVGRVSVGDNVFVGYGSIILPGVSIGNDTVVGAGAVVTKDVPVGKIVAGVPAKIVGDVSELKAKAECLMSSSHAYGQEYLRDQIDETRMNQMRAELAHSDGFIL